MRTSCRKALYLALIAKIFIRCCGKK